VVVSIPLLVWFIRHWHVLHAVAVRVVSIPLLVWFIRISIRRMIISLISFNSTVGLIYTNKLEIRVNWGVRVSIPLLVWFIPLRYDQSHSAGQCFNSTVGLIYTNTEITVIRRKTRFQFHCWSDLYSSQIPSTSSGWSVSIPLLVWFIHFMIMIVLL